VEPISARLVTQPLHRPLPKQHQQPRKAKTTAWSFHNQEHQALLEIYHGGYPGGVYGGVSVVILELMYNLFFYLIEHSFVLS